MTLLYMHIPSSPIQLGVLVLVVATIVYNIARTLLRRLPCPLPPSPLADPLIGHARKLPLENAHLKHMD